MMVWNGRLPGATQFGTRRVEREAVTAVLHRHAPARNDDARAETHVVALDEAHHHAALVGGAQVDRAAARRVAGREHLRARRVDQLRPAREIVRVEHLLGAQTHAARIGGVRVDVGERELHRLDLQVLRFGAVDRQRLDVEVAQDAERRQRRDALAVGRDLVQAVAVGVDADRLHPFRPVLGEVAHGHGAAVLPRVRGRRGGDLAAVERGAARRGDRAQRSGRCGKGEALADLRRPAMRQEGVGPAGHRAKQRRRGDPLLLHHPPAPHSRVRRSRSRARAGRRTAGGRSAPRARPTRRRRRAR